MSDAFMNEYAKRATHALAVCLARSQRLLECLDAGDVGQAEEIMRWRTAAFYNFRALDARALATGVDIRDDSQVVALVVALNELQEPLAAALRELHVKTGKQLGKVRDARQTLNSYRSQTEQRTRFASSV